jgi:hypothetical protein
MNNIINGLIPILLDSDSEVFLMSICAGWVAAGESQLRFNFSFGETQVRVTTTHRRLNPSPRAYVWQAEYCGNV